MRTIIPAIFIILLAAATAVQAVPRGRSLTFASSNGAVHFDGTLHNRHAKGCRQCHTPAVFPQMKQGSVAITMAAITSGKLCGICHNGKSAFAPAHNCKRCHQQ